MNLDDRNAYIIKLRNDGLSMREIGKQNNLSGQTISCILRISERKQARAAKAATFRRILPFAEWPIAALELSTRAHNSLIDFVTVGNLVKVPHWELLRIPNFGRKSFEELIESIIRLAPPNEMHEAIELLRRKREWPEPDWITTVIERRSE